MTKAEQFIQDYSDAVGSDSPPPEITKEQMRMLAMAYIKAQEQLGRIHGCLIIGYTSLHQRRAENLQHQMMNIHFFLEEVIPGESVNNQATQHFIEEVRHSNKNIGGK